MITFKVSGLTVYVSELRTEECVIVNAQASTPFRSQTADHVRRSCLGDVSTRKTRFNFKLAERNLNHIRQAHK